MPRPLNNPTKPPQKQYISAVVWRVLYYLLSYAILPLVFLRLLIKSRHNRDYGKRWLERLAYNLPPISQDKSRPPLIWLHTVSVGEFLACLPLIDELLNQSIASLLITTTTPTGSRQVQEKLAHYQVNQVNSRVFHCYMPFDVPVFMRRFVQRIQPSVVAFVETEVWPHALTELNQQRIPVFLINARLSESSCRAYQHLGEFTQQTLQRFQLIACQNEASQQRFKSLAASTQVLGNIKFDLQPPTNLQRNQQQLSYITHHRPLLVLASTHDDEEKQLLQALKTCIPLFKQQKILLAIAPRHPERAGQVMQICQQLNYHAIRLSVIRTSQRVLINEQVLIVDTLGELLNLYQRAKLAIIGGSFVAHGGHNPLEACLFKIPIIMGEHVFNFQSLVDDLLAEGAMHQLSTHALSELPQWITYFLNSEAGRKEAQHMGEAGWHYLQKNQGASKRYAKLLIDGLP